MKGDLGWAFAIINGRQGEVFFEIGKGIKGIHSHCYHNGKELWTKREKKMIKKDIKKNRFSYRKRKYRQVMSRS